LVCVGEFADLMYELMGDKGGFGSLDIVLSEDDIELVCMPSRQG